MVVWGKELPVARRVCWCMEAACRPTRAWSAASAHPQETQPMKPGLHTLTMVAAAVFLISWSYTGDGSHARVLAAETSAGQSASPSTTPASQEAQTMARKFTVYVGTYTGP